MKRSSATLIWLLFRGQSLMGVFYGPYAASLTRTSPSGNTEWEEPAAWSTLAVAYAELGDWPAATDICEDQLGKVDDGPAADELRELLELFEAEKPYRLSTTNQ